MEPKIRKKKKIICITEMKKNRRQYFIFRTPKPGSRKQAMFSGKARLRSPPLFGRVVLISHNKVRRGLWPPLR